MEKPARPTTGTENQTEFATEGHSLARHDIFGQQPKTHIRAAVSENPGVFSIVDREIHVYTPGK